MNKPPPALGVVTATLGEARCLDAVGGHYSSQRRIDGSVFVRVCGVGHAGAAAAAQQLVDNYADALISWGFAGALDPALQPGTLVLAARIVDAQGGTYTVNKGWLARLRAALARDGDVPAAAGTIVTCSAPVATPADKRHLWRTHGAAAVDMESGAVAAVARQARLPFIAIRSISDAADTCLPSTALAMVGSRGRLHVGRGLAHLARRPRDTVALWHLALGARRARLSLRTVARRTGPHFLAPPRCGPDGQYPVPGARKVPDIRHG